MSSYGKIPQMLGRDLNKYKVQVEGHNPSGGESTNKGTQGNPRGGMGRP